MRVYQLMSFSTGYTDISGYYATRALAKSYVYTALHDHGIELTDDMQWTTIENSRSSRFDVPNGPTFYIATVEVRE